MLSSGVQEPARSNMTPMSPGWCWRWIMRRTRKHGRWWCSHGVTRMPWVHSFCLWETEKASQEELCWQMGIPLLLEWESLVHGDRNWPLLRYRFCGSYFKVSISSSFKWNMCAMPRPRLFLGLTFSVSLKPWAHCLPTSWPRDFPTTEGVYTVCMHICGVLALGFA